MNSVRANSMPSKANTGFTKIKFLHLALLGTKGTFYTIDSIRYTSSCSECDVLFLCFLNR